MYKLFQKSNIQTDNILEVTLRNRGIEDIEAYKNTDDSVLIHYSKIHNMDKAVELYDKHNNEDANVVLVVDCDMDGYTSAASLLDYTKNNTKMTILPILHTGKQHGLSKEMMENLIKLNNERQIDLVILPDAGTSDIDEQKQLKGLGIDVLVLDHHESDKYNEEYATVVNIQFSPDYDNKQLSGVGVVYKFLQALDDKYDIHQADKYLDLVAMGMIGDSMSVKNLETRRLINKGLASVKNELLEELAKKFTNGVEGLTANSFSFKAAPKLNATIRIGTQEQKLDFLKALMNVEEQHKYQGRKGIKKETLAQKVVREATNAHARQATMKKKFLQIAIDKIEQYELYNNRVIIVTVPQNPDCQKLSGVLAADIMKKYKRPCLLLHLNSGTNSYTGSARSDDKFIKNTKDFLNSTGLFVHCSGHQSALGVELNKEVSFESVSKQINELLKDEPLYTDVSVDFELDKSQVTRKLIQEVQNYEKYWGKDVDAVSFGISNVTVNVDEIEASSKGTMMKFYDGDIQYMKFPSDDNIMQHVGKTLTLDVIGTVSVSKYYGNTDYQVTINDYEIKDIKKKSSLGFDINNIWGK